MNILRRIRLRTRVVNMFSTIDTPLLALTNSCRFDTVIPAMMANGTRVLIYAGDYDWICNWLGNQVRTCPYHYL